MIPPNRTRKSGCIAADHFFAPTSTAHAIWSARVAKAKCAPPATNCAVLSSPGAFGFTPWFDRDGGYYAILGMEVTESQSGVVAFAVNLAQELKPLIRTAL